VTINNYGNIAISTANDGTLGCAIVNNYGNVSFYGGYNSAPYCYMNMEQGAFYLKPSSIVTINVWNTPTETTSISSYADQFDFSQTPICELGGTLNVQFVGTTYKPAIGDKINLFLYSGSFGNPCYGEFSKITTNLPSNMALGLIYTTAADSNGYFYFAVTICGSSDSACLKTVGNTYGMPSVSGFNTGGNNGGSTGGNNGGSTGGKTTGGKGSSSDSVMIIVSLLLLVIVILI